MLWVLSEAPAQMRVSSLMRFPGAPMGAFPPPVFQKMGFCCVQKEGFWGRKPPFLPKSISCIVLGSNRSVTPPTELSVSPALNGNGSLKVNLRHLQIHNVHEDHVCYQLMDPGDRGSGEQLTRRFYSIEGVFTAHFFRTTK